MISLDFNKDGWQVLVLLAMAASKRIIIWESEETGMKRTTANPFLFSFLFLFNTILISKG
jgi:hypothetical protein